MEIVSEPDIRSSEEARQYLIKLRAILQYLGVSSADMEKGSFRCDANISIRHHGAEELRSKVEVKNMNSLRAVFHALEYEFDRQVRITEDGGRVPQETRGWVEERGVTVSQRSKEHAHDYRYFPEPDLPPLDIEPSWVQGLRAGLPELAPERCSRFQRDYGLSEYDARVLTGSKAMADYFEGAVVIPSLHGVALENHAKQVSNWVLGDLSGLLNSENRDISESPLSPEYLVELIGLVGNGTISVTMGKTVLGEAYASGTSPGTIVKEQGYTQISDTLSVEPAVREALEANPRAVADYLSGKESAAKFLVGQVMKITRGQAKPDLVNQLVSEALDRVKAGAG
jgi:aspartyl-tRNA(Asn)/glutamyl-tRNA(Gln) amidotransferase subunit B